MRFPSAARRPPLVLGVTLAAGLFALAAPPASATTQTTTYTTAGEHAYAIPSGATSLQVTVVGAAGSSTSDGGVSPGLPGTGASVQATIAPPSGATHLYAEVGSVGAGGQSLYAAAGGGASALQTCHVGSGGCTYTGNVLTDPRLLVAGGGGGGGEDSFFSGTGGHGGNAGTTPLITGPGAGGAGTDAGDGTRGSDAGLATSAAPAARGTGSGACGGLGSQGTVPTGGAGADANGGNDSDGGGGGDGWVGGSGGGAGGCDFNNDGSGGGGGAGASFVESSSTSVTVAQASTAAKVVIVATIADAPTASITAPADGATYSESASVSAAYTCTEGAGGSGLESGTNGCSGPVADGASIDTSTPGQHSFTVTAASQDGLTGGQTVHYTVLAPSTITTTVIDASSTNAWDGTEVTGATASDSASITEVNGTPPSGTVTYSLYSNGSCTGSPASTDAQTLTVSGNVPPATSTSALSAGDYSFQLTYSGDTSYQSSTSSCTSFTVNRATSATSASVRDADAGAAWAGTETAGAASQATAAVTAAVPAFVPTGTVTYALYNNSACSGAPADTDTVTLAIDGSVPNSRIARPLAAGDYGYTASYSGDADFEPSSTVCSPFTVAAAPQPPVTVQPPASTTPTSAAPATATPTTTATPTPSVVPATACPKPSGRLSGMKLGPISLGITRTQARAAFPRGITRNSASQDVFCLVPAGIRVVYASSKLVAAAAKAGEAAQAGRAVLALTANPYYVLDGVRAGMSFGNARTLLGTGNLLRLGANGWYFVTQPRSTAVIKIRGGIVRELGIAARQYTATRMEQLSFMTSL